MDRKHVFARLRFCLPVVRLGAAVFADESPFAHRRREECGDAASREQEAEDIIDVYRDT